MVEKIIKRYSMAFKKQVVQEYEQGAAITALHRKYGIPPGSTIKRWITQYSREGVRHKMIHIQRPEEQEQVKELQARVAELEKLVAQLSLDRCWKAAWWWRRRNWDTRSKKSPLPHHPASGPRVPREGGQSDDNHDLWLAGGEPTSLLSASPTTATALTSTIATPRSRLRGLGGSLPQTLQ